MSFGTRWAGRAALPAVLALALAAGARADEPPGVDRALGKQARDVVLPDLRDHHYKTVAVLKFLAAYDDGKPRDDLGVLNRTLADRLEVALVLGLTDDDERGLSILTHASDVVSASGNTKLNHNTEDGRAAFFSDHPPVFPRAWVVPGQKDEAPADAFLTGVAVIAKDWKTVRVQIQAFDRDDPKTLRKVGEEFTAAVDPRTLTELDVSFRPAPGKKGVPEEDDTPMQQVSKLDVVPPVVPGTPPPTPDEAKERQKAWDDFVAESPVKLDVLYNGEAVAVEGGAVRTPGVNDKVTFRLRNIDPKTTYGVVLKINGESSIDHQKMAPLDCYKWVLAPSPGPDKPTEITIKGFQVDGEMASEFSVLAPEASKGAAVNYADNAGVFSLVVFREAGKDDAGFVQNDDQKNEEVKAISRGSLSGPGEHPPKSLRGLQDQLTPVVLTGPDQPAKKGLIVGGGGVASKTRHVDFVPFPRPEYSLVVRYYQPQN